MFQILGDKRDVLEMHSLGLKNVLKKNIIVQKSKKGISKECYKLLEEMLVEKSEFYYDRIIRMRPERMLLLYDKLATEYPIFDKNGKSIFYDDKGNRRLDQNSELSEIFIKCFEYDKFSKKSTGVKWDAYELCAALKVNVCPYCNRQFVYTVMEQNDKKRKDKIVRPELDHYLPKAFFPMYALSFYNLIPCCHSCNSSIKGTNELDIEKHIHPYIQSKAEMYFEYEKLHMEEGKKKVQINIKYKQDDKHKLEHTCNFFQTKNIYQYHEAIVERYLDEAQEFPLSMLEEYKEFLDDNIEIIKKPGLKEILYQKFRVAHETDEMNEVLIKFRKDIVEQLWREKYEIMDEE